MKALFIASIILLILLGSARRASAEESEAVRAALDVVMQQPKPRARMGVYNEEDLQRARRNVERYGWARRIADQLIADAEFWTAKSDQELYDLIPPDNPRALVVQYSYGCPLHGGFYATLQTSLETPYAWYCPTGDHWWKLGMTVQNPGTGGDVVIADDGSGWVAPEGFPHAGQRYWFVAAYRLYLLGVLYASPYQPTVARKEVPPCLSSLAFAYALTGDRRYAHKALLLLNRLAELYRTFDGISDLGSRKTHIAEISTTETWYIERASYAYDLVFDALDGDQELLDFFAAHGGADYNGDGKVNADDLRFNVQRNLFGYMYELSSRLVREEIADWQIDYLKNLVQLAQMLGSGPIMHEALESARGLRAEMANAFFRDGKHWYCSLGYSFGNTGTMARIGEYAYGFTDPQFYPQPLDPFQDPDYGFGALLSFLREADCDGQHPIMGDGGSGRSHTLTPNYRVEDEIGLVRVPEARNIYRQRLFAACGGDVNAKRNDPWVLFHADDFDPTGLDAAASTNRSHLFPASLIALLRAGERRATRKHVGLHFCRGTAAHGHHDALALFILGYGWGLTPDVGYWCDAHRKHGDSWLRHAASHGLVVPDGRNQVWATGELHAYADLPGLKLVEASAADAYPGLEMYRRAVLLLPVNPHPSSLIPYPSSLPMTTPTSSTSSASAAASRHTITVSTP
jgi:hypothetical protein